MYQVGKPSCGAHQVAKASSRSITWKPYRCGQESAGTKLHFVAWNRSWDWRAGQRMQWMSTCSTCSEVFPTSSVGVAIFPLANFFMLLWLRWAISRYDVFSGGRCFFQVARSDYDALDNSVQDYWSTPRSIWKKRVAWVVGQRQWATIHCRGIPVISEDEWSKTDITSAPYHPATNGLAERFVQTMKQSLTSMTKGQGSTQTKLSRFLIKYRHTPHSKTGETPAALFMGRSLRTRLDLINQTSESTFFASKNSKRKQSPTVHVVKYVNYMSAKQWVQEITEGRRSGYQESSMLGQVLYHIKSKLQRMWSGGDTDQLLPSNIRTDTTDSKEAPELSATTYESDTEDEATQVQPDQRNDNPSLQPALSTQDQNTSESQPIPTRRYPVRIRQEPERL